MSQPLEETRGREPDDAEEIHRHQMTAVPWWVGEQEQEDPPAEEPGDASVTPPPDVSTGPQQPWWSEQQAPAFADTEAPFADTEEAFADTEQAFAEPEVESVAAEQARPEPEVRGMFPALRLPAPPLPATIDGAVDDPVRDVPVPTVPQAPDASAITDAAMLRTATPVPEKGMRRVVYRASGGHINPGPTKRQLEYADLIRKVETPIDGSRRIAVISRKGGVGKTTTALMLGHTFASTRGDRVVALDGNPDAGSLGYRVRRQTAATITDLLRDAPNITRYADIRDYTNQAPTRLEVIASDDDAVITQALGEHEYAQAIRLLDHHYNLILLDTGTGILDSATQGILRMVDQIVVVAAPSIDGARAASLTLDWLDRNGYDWLVAGAVAVLNQIRGRRGIVNVERLEDHFRQRCRATVALPWDPHLEAGAESNPRQLASRTRDAYLGLAAAVAEGFADPATTARY